MFRGGSRNGFDLPDITYGGQRHHLSDSATSPKHADRQLFCRFDLVVGIASLLGRGNFCIS
jgi:hypothetical protein